MHGHRYVYQIGITQVDLCQAAGTFHNDGVVAGGHPVVCGMDSLAQLFPAFFAEIVVGVAIADGFAVEDDLGSMIALRLEQQGIHVGMAGDAGRLDGLGTSNLASVGCGKGVEGHVLRLKRCRGIAVLPEDPAKGGSDDAFAHIAAGSGEHHGMESFFHRWFL